MKLAADEEKNTGQRLLDCVVMHYPFLGAGLGDTRALWDLTFTPYNTPALAMYRKHDGTGAKFGGYPTSPSKVWVMLVNVSDVDQNDLSITVRNFAPTATAAVYRADASGTTRAIEFLASESPK